MPPGKQTRFPEVRRPVICKEAIGQAGGWKGGQLLFSTVPSLELLRFATALAPKQTDRTCGRGR
jgi:hypothetical protein